MTENGRNDFLRTTNLMGRIVKPFVDIPFPKFSADIFIDDLKDLNAFAIGGKLHHTIGHTNGSISIEFDNKEAIIGDVLMGGYFGRQLFPHQPRFHYFADSIKEIENSVQKLLSWDCNKYYVGHGGGLQKKDIEKRFGKKPNG